MEIVIENIFGEVEKIKGKICNCCHEFKPLTMYSFFNGSKASGIQNECMKCRNEKKRRGEYFKKHYIIPDDHKCEICKRTREELKGRYAVEFVFDHDHKTKELRGIICNDCNIGLGKFKDNPEILIEAVLYLIEKNDYELYLKTLDYLQGGYKWR